MRNPPLCGACPGAHRSVGCHAGGHRRNRRPARPRLHHAVRRYRSGPCVFATEGKDARTVAAFADDLAAHGGAPGDRRGLHRHEPGLHQGHRRAPAQRRDHLRQVPCRQDRQRCGRSGAAGRTEAQAVLRGTRYIWLRNPANLSDRQRRRSTRCPRGISRPHAPIRSGLPSRISTTSRRRGRARLPEEMVLLGHPQPARRR